MNICQTIPEPGAGRVDACAVTRDEFICQALKLLPPGVLFDNGACTVKDLFCAIAGTYYDQWQRICALEPETSPCTADVTLDEWAEVLSPACNGLPEDRQELRDTLCRLLETQGTLSCDLITAEVEAAGYTALRCETDCRTFADLRDANCVFEFGFSELGCEDYECPPDVKVCGFELGYSPLGIDSSVSVQVGEGTERLRACTNPDAVGETVCVSTLGCTDGDFGFTEEFVDVTVPVFQGFAAPNGVFQSTRRSRQAGDVCFNLCATESTAAPDVVLPDPCAAEDPAQVCSPNGCACSSDLGAFTTEQTFSPLVSPSTINVYLDPADFPCSQPMETGLLIPQSGELGVGPDCRAGVDLNLCVVEALTPAHVTINYIVECA